MYESAGTTRGAHCDVRGGAAGLRNVQHHWAPPTRQLVDGEGEAKQPAHTSIGSSAVAGFCTSHGWSLPARESTFIGFERHENAWALQQWDSAASTNPHIGRSVLTASLVSPDNQRHVPTLPSGPGSSHSKVAQPPRRGQPWQTFLSDRRPPRDIFVGVTG